MVVFLFLSQNFLSLSKMTNHVERDLRKAKKGRIVITIITASGNAWIQKEIKNYLNFMAKGRPWKR